jgi:hypothetical protein
MNRTQLLKQNLLHNLNLIYSLKDDYNIELVLINYDSEDDMDDYIKDEIFNIFKDENILIYKKVLNKEFFYHSHAKNISHLNATGDILCNLDSDCFLSKQLIDETYDSFITYGIDNIIVIGYFNYNYGYICLSNINFKLIDGYDENLQYYASEDVDLIARFCLKTKNKIYYLKNNYWNLVIQHSDSLRSTPKYNKYVTNFVNSLKILNNFNNNITNPNNGIYGIEDAIIKNRELVDIEYIKKYISVDIESINQWNKIYNLNDDNWTKILTPLNDFFMRNFL